MLESQSIDCRYTTFCSKYMIQDILILDLTRFEIAETTFTRGRP